MRGKVSSYKGRKTCLWKIALALILAGALTFCALLGAVMWGDRDQILGDPGAMVVLGCEVRATGPSVLLQDRLDEALAYFKENPDLLVVVSGGQGPNEPTTEARAMADYLLAQGVPAEQLLLEEQSHNTSQNLRYSKALLEGAGYPLEDGVVVVSNGFHLTRSAMLAQRFGYGRVSRLSAPASHLPSRMSMYVREPLALAKSIVLDH